MSDKEIHHMFKAYKTTPIGAEKIALNRKLFNALRCDIFSLYGGTSLGCMNLMSAMERLEEACMHTSKALAHKYREDSEEIIHD